MKTRHLFLTAILAFLALSAVQADTPELINYQGRLTNPDGSPQAGTKTFSLSIWDDATGGAALYSEDLGEILLDENGIYSFQFGADSAALAQALQAGGQHWIELTVDNAVLSPRQRILAVPFALKAAQADTDARAGSVGDDDGNVDITGNLDIAKNTTLRRDLNVEGDAIFRNNRTTFDGEVRLNGPVTSDGQVNISGALNAGRLEVNGGPFGSTRLDGVINRLSGDINQINAFETMFEGDRVRFRNLETRFDSEFNVFRGNETRFENNRTTFDGEVRLNGPITDSSHAVNKAYVDALGDTLEAKEAARVAALTNIDLVAPAPEIDGVTLAEGDRVLLAGQTNSAENGVYLSGADGILTRAGDFNAIEKIGGGSHLFIQEGSKAGQGYVLADLGEAFELGTSALAFSRFTVDPTQSLDLGNDLAVAGNADVDGALNAGRMEVNGPRGITRIDGVTNIIYGDLDTRFEGNNVEFRNNRTTFDGEVRLNGPVTSDGEVSISGALNAGRLEVFGPGGITRIDGVANIIYGDLETRVEGGPLVVQGAVEALSFNTVSDRNRKENFEAVNGTEVLEKVTNLPVSTWNFIADEDSARHLGPTAQDFHAAFGLGEHETHISTVDVSGVAIAAIQGLDGKVDATRAELLQSNAALLEMVQALQARLETLEANQ